MLAQKRGRKMCKEQVKKKRVDKERNEFDGVPGDLNAGERQQMGAWPTARLMRLRREKTH